MSPCCKQNTKYYSAHPFGNHGWVCKTCGKFWHNHPNTLGGACEDLNEAFAELRKSCVDEFKKSWQTVKTKLKKARRK